MKNSLVDYKNNNMIHSLLILDIYLTELLIFVTILTIISSFVIYYILFADNPSHVNNSNVSNRSNPQQPGRSKPRAHVLVPCTHSNRAGCETCRSRLNDYRFMCVNCRKYWHFSCKPNNLCLDDPSLNPKVGGPLLEPKVHVSPSSKPPFGDPGVQIKK